MTRISEEDLNIMLRQGHCKISKSNNYSPIKKVKEPVVKKKGRINQKKVEIDGHQFDSKDEALIYSEFKIDPDVEILELQPKFTLVDAFKRKNKSYRMVTYTPDFKIKEGGRQMIIEVKSIGTLRANSKSYPLRRKLFLKKYPELNFREIIFDGKKRTIKDY